MIGSAGSCKPYCADMHLLGTARARFPGIVSEMKDEAIGVSSVFLKYQSSRILIVTNINGPNINRHEYQSCLETFSKRKGVLPGVQATTSCRPRKTSQRCESHAVI